MAKPTGKDADLIQPMSRTTLVSDKLDQSVELIHSGSWGPGEKLPPERELANKLGVGRTSLREALHALTMMGLLDARPGEGTFVAQRSAELLLHLISWSDPTTRDNVHEWGKARRLVEGELAALAAQRGSGEELALIRDCAEQTVRSCDNVEEHLHADWLIHQAISEAAHNSHLVQTILLSRHVMRETMAQAPMQRSCLLSGLEEHAHIRTAIEASEPTTAGLAMQKHIDASLGRLLEHVDA